MWSHRHFFVDFAVTADKVASINYRLITRNFYLFILIGEHLRRQIILVHETCQTVSSLDLQEIRFQPSNRFCHAP